jgi:hypothetical protein
VTHAACDCTPAPRGLQRRADASSNRNDLGAAHAGSLETLLRVVRFLAGLERTDDHLLPGVGHTPTYGETERGNLR